MRRSFAAFARWGWPLVTGRELVPNGATIAVTAALQSVADGSCSRLLIAMPPGVGKSTLLALYAAWRLARDPSWRSIHGAHAYAIARTESLRVRRLVEGDAFRALFPRVQLRTDESSVEAWSTTAGGAYYAIGSGGALTGRRAHETVVDDPLNASDRYSKAARDASWAWFTESLSTRLDGDRAPQIVVAQRLDADDLIGRLIAQGGWTLVELPAESEDGTLLAPSILPREKLDALKAQIGSATYACQYLQRPASDDASSGIRRSWWRFHHGPHVSPVTPRPDGCDTTVPAVATPRGGRVVIAADLTFGSMKGDFVSIQAWSAVGAARFLLAHWRRRAGLLESVDAIKAMVADYPGAPVLVEQAANGAGAIEELRAAGVSTVRGVKPLGSKAQRLGLVSATIEAGSCYLPLGAAWLSEYVEELAGATRFDDSADSCAYALHELNRRDLFASGSGSSDGGDVDSLPVPLDIAPAEAAIEAALSGGYSSTATSGDFWRDRNGRLDRGSW